MSEQSLQQAVGALAAATQALSDADMGQPWAWGPHQEGVRFALIGAYHELRDLAVRLAAERRRHGPPQTMAQHALAQYQAAYRDLQAVLLGVTADMYDTEPAPGAWQLRYVLGHTAATERVFFTLVHYALQRAREDEERPLQLPEGEVERVVGSRDDFVTLMENGTLAEMWDFYERLHARALAEFVGISDAEMETRSLWWEGIEYTLHHRLHRFDAHLRQHTVQAEKTLAAIGHPPNEAQRLLRLVYQALAEVEGVLLGAPDLGREARAELAAQLAARAQEVEARADAVHRLQTAATAGDLDTVKQLVAEEAALANAQDEQEIPLVLAAHYNGRRDVVAYLVDAGAELNVFAAAALGNLELVQQEVSAWDGWIHEYGTDGFTPLQLACYFGHEAVAAWLIAQGADVEAAAKNRMRIRPLHAAAANGNLAILETLLAHGADVNAQQARGFTALHTAADSNNPEMARLLLQHGADRELHSDDGQTPLALAQAKGRDGVAAVLQTAG